MLGFLVSWLIGVRTYLLIPRWETNQLGFHKWCLTPIYYLICGLNTTARYQIKPSIACPFAQYNSCRPGVRPAEDLSEAAVEMFLSNSEKLEWLLQLIFSVACSS